MSLPSTPTKSLSQSATVGFNAGTLTAALIFIVGAFAMPEVAAIIPSWLMGTVVAIMAVINLYLRIYKTSQPIAL